MNTQHIEGATEAEALMSFLKLMSNCKSAGFGTDSILEVINDYFQAEKSYVLEYDERKSPIDVSVPHIKSPVTLEGEIVGYLIVENPKSHQDHQILLTVIAGALYKEIIHAKESQLIQELRRTRIDLEYINKTIEDSGIGIWGIFSYDTEEPQMVANPKMLELLGLKGQKLTNQEVYRHWFTRIVPEYEQSVRESVAEMLLGKHSENTYMWNHPTKGHIYVRCGGMLSVAKSGTKFLSGYHSDVTDIILKEQETQKKLEFATLEAKKANEARAAFLSRMSHDIRTPLNGIIGLLEIGDKHPDDRALVDANRAKARTAANHLLSLVNDVLNLNKLEDENFVLAHEAFNLLDVTKEIATIIDIRANEEGLTFNAGDCQHLLSYPYVYGSPLHFKQIMLNVLSNSIKYNKKNGSLSCTAEIQSADDKRVVYRFILSDTGIGMSEDFQKKMFEPFSQERMDARSTFQGTGLGLAIAKTLVERMKGTMEVNSKLDVGTTFTITIPFDIAREEDVPKNISSENFNMDGRKILLVEDNALNTEIAKAILTDMGALVTEVSNGKLALEKFESSPEGCFDLILMDIMMPEMNGYEATRAIRALPRDDAKLVPIVAMSANAFEEDRQHCLEAGMNAHLAKPINIQDLTKELAKILG